MAKLNIDSLKPGKKYRMVVVAKGTNNVIDSIPSFTFRVPNSPPPANTVSLGFKATAYSGTGANEDRTLTILKWKSSSSNSRVTIMTGAAGTKHGIRVGDRVTVTSIGTISTGTGGAKVVAVPQPNQIQYVKSSIGNNAWTSGGGATFEHDKGGVSSIKNNTSVTLTIPDSVYNNLLWTDTVRDFVHITYMSSSQKNKFGQSVRKLLDKTTVIDETSSIPSVTWSNYPNGSQPKVVTKWVIPDSSQFYQFQFFVARYISTDGGTTWNGYYLEQAKPFKNRFSKGVGGGVNV